MGTAIPLTGRLVAVADVFDAFAHRRPYKSAWPVREAAAEILSQSGVQFDPSIVEAKSIQFPWPNGRQTYMTTSGPREHPRTIGWLGTVALAIGGSNRSLLLIGALLAVVGTAAVPLLVGGLLLSWAALPGWTELVVMWPERVGGIAATCAEAFRPYSALLANVTGVCYWLGWVPVCGLTALVAAAALHSWYLPGVPVHLLAAVIVVVFMVISLTGLRRATRVAIPIACASATLAILSALVPALSGAVDWHRAVSFHLQNPLHGVFGGITGVMAGLFLIGFAAPAFEAAACHVGETRDPVRNVPRAMYRAAGTASIYFVVLPVIWLGTFGPKPLEGDLAAILGPVLAPALGAAAKGAAVWFIVLSMFNGTLQPLAGASRSLSQLADDGLVPASWSGRNRFDVPWVTTTLTAGTAIVLLSVGYPTWVLATANLAYLTSIAMPSLAVWLLRRNEPERERPYRAPRGTIGLGVAAAIGWLTVVVLGFEQFGLPTMIAALVICSASVGLFGWRSWRDGRGGGAWRSTSSLHARLTLAMLSVGLLDGAGYWIAITYASSRDLVLVTVLKDIFVVVALVTMTVGVVLPGIVSNAIDEIVVGATRLAGGTLAELTRAMQALSRGDLDGARAGAVVIPVKVREHDELGMMADSFNQVQQEAGRAAEALDAAREGLRSANAALARQASRQAAVARLGVHAMQIGDLEDLMVEIAEVARAALEADSVVISEYDDARSAVRIRASHGLANQADGASLETPRLEPLIMDADRKLVVPDWDLHGPARPALLCDARARATLAVEIIERDREFGAMVVNWRQPHEIRVDEVDTLRAIANLFASATEHERHAQDMRHRAMHDVLTGLPNRRQFVDCLGRAIERSTRRGLIVAVMFLDIDHFKSVNDSLGHAAGDALLSELGARLEAHRRVVDTVARFGGDEFVLICEDLRDQRHAADIARRLIDELGRPFEIAGSQQTVSVSVGVALTYAVGRDPEDVIADADEAMYRAKQGGRDRYEIYDEGMRLKAGRQLRIETELRSAIERDELQLVYQPVVVLPEGEIDSVEALVRWRHPRLGLLEPDEFIPAAERTGLIIPLGRWTLREASRQAVLWRDHNPGRRLPVAVNLSTRQVTHRTLLDMVREAIADSGVDPTLLQLEVTESVLMDPSERNIERFKALKELGVSVALDDFGTGYSSLAYVKRFPIDTLKIDRSFVNDLIGPAPDASIVEAIIAMARGLHVAVIAEGVETREQAESLMRMGCTHCQGYLFSKPVRPGTIDDILAGVGDRLWPPAAPTTGTLHDPSASEHRAALVAATRR